MQKGEVPGGRGNAHGRKIVAALRAATAPAWVQVAIGVWAPVKEPAPEMCLARFVEREPGRCHLVPEEIRMARLNSRLVRLLGFDGQWHTLVNLAAAGFIEVIRIAPHVRLLNLDSWFNHLRRCAEDPGMWDAGSAACEAYLAARRQLRREGEVNGRWARVKRTGATQRAQGRREGPARTGRTRGGRK